jgi:F-type H+-transporting ATPase subunit delta
MKISNRQLARNLYTALQEVKEKDHSQVLKNFVQIIYKMRKMSQVDRIIDEYIKYEKEVSGEVALEVTTAHELTSEMKKMLEKDFGKDITVTEHIDESILGGIIIKTNNTIYDASIKASINQLKNTL